ncbi:MAG: hypothetical protein JXR58_08145, partial [Bacteroidales bacterium]|nr:hypothetical protein [Bacteroidales bacterium]
MKNNLIILLLSLLLAAAKAQTPAPSFEWVVYPEGEGYSEGISITIDNNGYIYSVGFFNDTMTFNGNLVEEAEGLYFHKMNIDGESVWMKTITNSPIYAEVEIQSDINDNIFMVGYFSRQLDLTDTLLTTDSYYVPWPPDYTAYKIDMFIAKFNSDGDFLWARQISNPDPMEEYLGVFTNHFSIATDALGNLLLQGWYDSYIVYQPDYTFPVTNYTNYLLKISPEGELVWNSLNPQIRIWDIACDNNNDVYLTGEKEHLDPEDTLFFANDTITKRGILLKQNSDGNELWGKVLPGEDGIGEQISFNGFGNIFLRVFYPDSVIVLSELVLPNNSKLIKTELDGVGIWAKPFYGYGHHKIKSNYNSIYIGGLFQDTLFINEDTIFSVSNSQDCYILKYNNEGDYEWIKTAGGELSEAFFDMDIDQKENVYFTGSFHNETIFDNIFINTGIITGFIAKIDTLLITNSFKLFSNNKAKIFPNPCTDYFNIEINNIEDFTINIYNMYGIRMKSLEYKNL